MNNTTEEKRVLIADVIRTHRGAKETAIQIYEASEKTEKDITLFIAMFGLADMLTSRHMKQLYTSEIESIENKIKLNKEALEQEFSV